MFGKRIQEKSKKAVAYPIPSHTQVEVRDYNHATGKYEVRGMVTGHVNANSSGPYLVVYDNGHIGLCNYDTFVDKYEEVPNESNSR